MDLVQGPHDHPPEEFDHLLDGLEPSAHAGNPERRVLLFKAGPSGSVWTVDLADRRVGNHAVPMAEAWVCHHLGLPSGVALMASEPRIRAISRSSSCRDGRGLL